MKKSTASETPNLFVDTWGWLALEDAAEPAHEQVRLLRARYARRGGLWVTTDYVLDETITRLFARRPFAEAARFCDGVFKARKLGLLTVERVTEERFEKAYQLRLRFRDKPRISFTDLTSFAVMQELKIVHVLTQDSHFLQGQLGFQTLP
jgi:predicted nucleic acid-binding protein